ncbi:MAG: ubiquitin-like domain-containing protein [Actinomycetes bacterium]
MRRSPAVAALQALVISVLVGGTTAFVSLDKTVTLAVDGQQREVRSFGRTVGEVLAREGVPVSLHDQVAPSLGTQVRSGTRIAVRHSRLLTLTLDGATRQYWVTATNVSDALQAIGLRTEDAYLSASRSRRIPTDGMALTLRTEREVVVLADGKRRVVTTTAASVREVLADVGLRLGNKDKVSASLASFPLDGQVLEVTRMGKRRVEVNVDIPHETVRRENADMFEGETQVVQRGRPGLKVNTYEVRYVNDDVRSRRLISSRRVERPVTEILEVGTKERSTGVEDLNWAALAECESGGDPNAVNPAGPYYGLYQFSQATWEAAGGTGVPTDASADEQTYRAQVLYQSSGAGQWPNCGHHLYD